jgi:ribosomal protein S18
MSQVENTELAQAPKRRADSGYTRVGREEFKISPIPNEDGQIVEVDLSNQAQEFIKSGKNRIQINNQSNDILEINSIDEAAIDYKNLPLLKKYTTQFDLIKQMSAIGLRTNMRKKRLLAKAIKRARFLALLSYPDQQG